MRTLLTLLHELPPPSDRLDAWKRISTDKSKQRKEKSMGQPCGRGWEGLRGACKRAKKGMSDDERNDLTKASKRELAQRIKSSKRPTPTIEERIRRSLDPSTPKDKAWVEEVKALRKANPELYAKLNTESQANARQKELSRRGQKASATRKRRSNEKTQRETDLSTTPEGLRLLQAEKDFDAVKSSPDSPHFDRRALALQRAQDNHAIASAYRKPSPAQRQYNANQPTTNLGKGEGATESWRIKGMNTKVAGNYGGSGAPTGVPWSVKVPSASGYREIVLAGAELAPDYFAAPGKRVVLLHGTEGQTYRVNFPKGDRETSMRAKRLIREIGQGKAKREFPIEDLEGLIAGDDYLKEANRDRLERRQKIQAEAESMDRFIQSKGYQSWGELPERVQAAYMQQWIRQQGDRTDSLECKPLARNSGLLRSQ